MGVEEEVVINSLSEESSSPNPILCSADASQSLVCESLENSENDCHNNDPALVLIREEEGDAESGSLLGAQHLKDGSLEQVFNGDLHRDESFSYRHMHFFSRDEKDSIYANNFYITIPWSPQVYFTVRGAENFHIYLWIAKDLCWTQSWYYPAYFFGSSAMAWCLILLYHAITARCVTEVYMLIPMILWLCANFIWMSGEVFHGDDDQVVPLASHIMEVSEHTVLVYQIARVKISCIA